MKKILFYTDLMPFLSDSEKALSKLQKNLEIFKSYNNEIRLVWHPYSRTEEFLKLNNCEFIDDYLKIIDYFKTNDLGEYNEQDDYAELARTCDAYYGDYSDMIPYFQENNKPVMIQNINLQ